MQFLQFSQFSFRPLIISKFFQKQSTIEARRLEIRLLGQRTIELSQRSPIIPTPAKDQADPIMDLRVGSVDPLSDAQLLESLVLRADACQQSSQLQMDDRGIAT